MKSKLSLYSSICVLTAVTAPFAGAQCVNLTGSAPYTQDFNNLATTGTTNVLSAAIPGWTMTESGGGARDNEQYAADTGASNTGDTYSYGAAATPSDRALGTLRSGTLIPIFGACFTNNTGSTITALTIQYTGKQFRVGTAGRVDRLDFQYSLDATDLTTGMFTDLNSLDYSATGTVAGAVVPPVASAVGPQSIPGLSIALGATFWIRWTDFDASGADDGLAVDDFSLTPALTGVGVSTNPSAIGSATTVTAGNATTFSGTVTSGANPASVSYTSTCNLTGVGGSSTFPLSVSGGSLSGTYNVPLSTPASTYPLACVVTDDQNRSGNFSISLTIGAAIICETGVKTSTAIHTIQGAGATSLLSGQQVEVEGIVVGSFQDANHLKGFYLQEPDATWDSDPKTSEGIFVFDNLTGPVVNIGDRVRVRGSVDEFPSSGSFLGVTQNSSLTEIGTVVGKQVCSTGNTFTRTTLSLPITNAGDLEAYEGMAVQFTQQLTVTGNFSLGTFDQIDLAPSLLYTPTATPDQSTWAAKTSLNAHSVIALDDASTLANANLYPTIFPQGGLSATNTLRSGDLVNYDSNSKTNSPLVGVLDDRFGEYRIEPTASVTFFSANPRPAIAPILTNVGGRFRAVSANVLNFFTSLNGRGASNQTEFDHQKTKMVEALGGMDGDVYGLSEVQNASSGSTGGAPYTNAAVQSIVDGLNCHKAGLADLCSNPPAGPYTFVDTLSLGALNGTDAIRSVIVYRSDKLTPVGSPAMYYQNDTNRPSLAQTFQPATGLKAASQTFTFVVNHFRSKGSACGGASDDPFQGSCNGLRLNMAQNVVGWLAGNPTGDPLGASRRLMIVGDFNAYFGEDPIQYFIGQGYTNLINKIIGTNAYSYNFGSQAGYLDHVMANSAMNGLVKSVAEWHNNADEPSSLQALDSSDKSPAAQIAYYGADPYAASDHDPIVIGFNPLCGDLNDDGVVDATDQNMMRAAIGKSLSTVDRRMDFDGDGKITLTDFSKWSSCAAAYQR